MFLVEILHKFCMPKARKKPVIARYFDKSQVFGIYYV